MTVESQFSVRKSWRQISERFPLPQEKRLVLSLCAAVAKHNTGFALKADEFWRERRALFKPEQEAPLWFAPF